MPSGVLESGIVGAIHELPLPQNKWRLETRITSDHDPIVVWAYQFRGTGIGLL